MSVARALRALTLERPGERPGEGSAEAWSQLAPPTRLSVALAFFAVVLQLTVSSNLLTMLGIAYNTDGGNPVAKFHPATYLAFLALLVRLFASGRPLHTLEQLLLRFPRAALFMVMILVCMTMVIVNSGVSGVAVYIESYFSAGVLLLVLADTTLEQRRWLAWMMLVLFVGNAVLATGEAMVQHNLLPVYLAHGEVYHDVAYEFRGLALYDHALTGGTMTEMGLLLLIGMRLPPRIAVALGVPLLIGLISFGGRTSLVVSVLTLTGIGGFYLVRGIAGRTARPAVILGAIVGVVAAAFLLWFLIAETSVGVRLAGKLSFNDDSTATRRVQWLMPGLMNWNELLFGVGSAREVEYIYQLGLVYRFDIVENFWLVTFMNLGIIGFFFYFVGFFAFLVDMWRMAPLFGRAIIVTTIVVASSSNSLGRKSNVLFVMTAAIVATTGFARTRAERVADARNGLLRGGGVVPVLPPGAGALRPWGSVASSASLAGPAAKEARNQPAPPRLNGLVRDPGPPARALRPLRLDNVR